MNISDPQTIDLEIKSKNDSTYGLIKNLCKEMSIDINDMQWTLENTIRHIYISQNRVVQVGVNFDADPPIVAYESTRYEDKEISFDRILMPSINYLRNLINRVQKNNMAESGFVLEQIECIAIEGDYSICSVNAMEHPVVVFHRFLSWSDTHGEENVLWRKGAKRYAIVRPIDKELVTGWSEIEKAGYIYEARRCDSLFLWKVIAKFLRIQCRVNVISNIGIVAVPSSINLGDLINNAEGAIKKLTGLQRLIFCYDTTKILNDAKRLAVSIERVTGLTSRKFRLIKSENDEQTTEINFKVQIKQKYLPRISGRNGAHLYMIKYLSGCNIELIIREAL